MFNRHWTVLLAAGLSVVLLTVASGEAESLPDPTRPPRQFSTPVPAEDALAEQWSLGSILVSPLRRVAIINGQPVSVGDQIHGAKVMAIDPDRVRLRRGGSEMILKLLPGPSLRKVIAEKD